MIVLIGFMGAGKSTVGRKLAVLLDERFVDADELVEETAGRTIPEIFEASGEGAFRAVESAVVTGLLRSEDDGVLALGGGAADDPEVAASLAEHQVVHLEVDLGTALKRIGGSERPMLTLTDPAELWERRAFVYRRVASVTVDATGTPAAVAEEIHRRVSERIRVRLGPRSYDVVVAPGARSRVAAETVRLLSPEKVFVVVAPPVEAVARSLADDLEAEGIESHILPIPDGETDKSPATATRLLESLAERGAHRTDAVIGVGGGVITDLAGFVASTYGRGIAVAHVPTTLLGQVDAAIGGKTGVNLPQGKNLVGTFHQPLFVICDVEVLATLPQAELVAGMAEVIKCGLIAAPEILDIVLANAPAILARDPDVLDTLVRAAVTVKARVVASDERDGSLRAVLNYGHTFGHAIELATGFGAIRHGEAVALGMMAAAYTAREMDLLDDAAVDLHRRVLDAVGLPVAADLDLDRLEDAWKLDKKHDGGTRFVLLEAVGKPRVGLQPPRDALARALERMSD